MASIEFKTALRHWPELLAHPGWVSAYIRSGRTGLFRKLVSDSLFELHGSDVPRSVIDLAGRAPVSAIGRMGGTQEYLYHLVRLIAPQVVVETGVFRGISSAFILAALEENGDGKLFSIDLPGAKYSVPGKGLDQSPLPEGETTGFSIPTTIRARWNLTLGNSRLELGPLLERVGPVDMFFHDSEHSYEFMRWEYDTALPHIRGQGILASDDVNWNSAFSELSHDPRIGYTTILGGKLGIAVTRGD